MKIGLISDIKHADIREELSLWAIGKVLKERGILSVIMQESQEGGMLSKFAADQFAICAASEEELEKFGIYKQLRGYITDNEALYRRFHAKKEAEGKVLLYLKHPIFLASQVSLHGISIKPELTEPVLFADIDGWSEEVSGWIAGYCEKKGIRHLAAVEKPGVPKKIKGVQKITLVAKEAEEYLGYVWMADAVVTDTYVGMALAALHEKEFALLPGQETPEREEIEDIISEFSLKGQKVEDLAAFRDASYEIAALTEFRNALHAYRNGEVERMEEQLHLDDADMLVKCPVRLPVSQCTACGACEAVCPEDAIHMEMDKRGFRYPVADPLKCNECDWCFHACPKKGRRQLVQYASDALPEIYVGEAPLPDGKYDAYSGLFREIVRFVLTKREGVIFGSRLNENLEPEIVWTEKEEEAAAFAQQRYLTSRTLTGFRKIREFLEEGRFVMFAGIPCECAALKGYLKRNYTKLFVCEFLCHGAVSEKFFRKYADFLSARQGSPLKELRFGKFPADSMASTKMMVSIYEDGKTLERKYSASPYYQMLEQQVPVNEGCTNCSYNIKKKVGDITIGDLKKVFKAEVPKAWRNYSLVMANTERGSRALKRLEKVTLVRTDYDTVLKYQHRKNAALSKERAELLKRLDKDNMNDLLRNYQKNSVK